MNKFEERFNRWKNGENYWDIVGKPFGKQKTKLKKLTDEQRANLNQYLNSLDRFDDGSDDPLKITFIPTNIDIDDSEIYRQIHEEQQKKREQEQRDRERDRKADELLRQFDLDAQQQLQPQYRQLDNIEKAYTDDYAWRARQRYPYITDDDVKSAINNTTENEFAPRTTLGAEAQYDVASKSINYFNPKTDRIKAHEMAHALDFQVLRKNYYKQGYDQSRQLDLNDLQNAYGGGNYDGEDKYSEMRAVNSALRNSIQRKTGASKLQLNTVIDNLTDQQLKQYINDNRSEYFNQNMKYNPDAVKNALKNVAYNPVVKHNVLLMADTGKDPISVQRDGVQYNVDPSAIGAKNLEVTLPETVVQGYSPEYKQRHYASSFDPNGAGEFVDIAGLGFIPNPFNFTRDILNRNYYQAAKEAAKAMMFGDGWAETAANGIFGANILTDNGVKKTYNHVKNKQYTSALLSGLGDALDASMLGRFSKQLGNVRLPYLQNIAQYLNPQNSTLHITNNSLHPLYIQSRTPLLKHKAQFKMPALDAGLYDAADNTFDNIMSKNLFRESTNRLVDKNGNVDKREIARFLNIFKENTGIDFHKQAKGIYNSGNGRETNLIQHIADVVKTAQDSPVPSGYTKQQQVQAALLHDLGKIYGTKHHGPNSLNVIDQAQIPFISDAVKNSVKNHMKRVGMRDFDNLTKSLIFADVSRGLPFDQAAYTYPQLLYKRRLPQLNIKDIPLREELKTRINPWLKQLGYKTIDLNSTKEQAEQQLQEIIDEHRSFLRGARDPKDAQTISAEQARINYNNAANGAMNAYGENTPESRTKYSVEYVSSSPTGYGRSGLWERDGSRITTMAKRFGLDPNKHDALYMSTSDNIARTYQHAHNREGIAYLVRLLNPNIDKSANLSKRLLLSDWDLYNGYSAEVNYPPIGTFSMFEGPYRLQTGRSLIEDIKKSDPNVPKLEFAKTGGYVDQTNNTYLKFRGIMNRINSKLRDLGIDTQLHEYGISFNPDGTQNGIGTIFYPTGLQELDTKILVAEKYFSSQDPKEKFDFLKRMRDLALISDKQFKAVKFSGNQKYIDKDKTIMKVVRQYKDKAYELANKKSTPTKESLKNQYNYLHDYNRLSAFLKERGILPRYDLETFNKDVVIGNEAPSKNSTINRPIKKIIHSEVIGKRGEQKFKAIRPINVSDQTPSKHRDKGERTDEKVTRKSFR